MPLRSYATGSLLICSLFACGLLAPAADPPMPRSIAVPLRPPATWFAPPPPPTLSAEQTRSVQLWMIAARTDPDVLYVLTKMDALLNHPANAGRVRNANEAREILAGAISALRYERGDAAPPLSSQLFGEFTDSSMSKATITLPLVHPLPPGMH